MTPVIVVWEDALHDLDFDGKPEDAGKTIILREIGFLVKKNRQMVVIANEATENGENIRGTVSIPASLVRKIIELRELDGQ